MQMLQAPVGEGRGGAVGGRVELAPGFALPGFVVRFDRGEEVFAEGDPARFAYAVISGGVREVRLLDDGRRQVLAFHQRGDAFGLERRAAHPHGAETILDSEIAVVRRSVLAECAETDGAAARKLWGLASRDVQRLQDHLVLLGRKTALERVTWFLNGLRAGKDGPAEVEVPMCRSDIADYLGLTIETVSRTLTQLEREGAISIPSHRRIVLHDWLNAALV